MYFGGLSNHKAVPATVEEFADNASGTRYIGYIFEDDRAAKFFSKYVFETSAQADAYAAAHQGFGGYIAIDNVAYLEETGALMLDVSDKEGVVTLGTGKADAYNGHAYTSEPQ